jgi:hypothetical protein
MKYILFRKPLLLSLGLCMAVVASQVAQAAIVQFESGGDLADFNQLTGTDGVSINFEHSATAGTGGSGGLVHTATGPQDTTAVYTPAAFDLTTGVMHTATIDFKTGTVTGGSFSGSANAVVMLGFSANSNTGFYSNAADAFIGGRLRHRSSAGGADGLQSQTKIAGAGAVSSPADASLADITFASDNWYRLSLSVTRDATLNQFSYSMTLEDIGATGTSTPASLTNGAIMGTFLNADLYNDTTAYAAFRGVPTVANSNVAFDNFTITPAIPEPATMALIAIGLLGSLTTRRF